MGVSQGFGHPRPRKKFYAGCVMSNSFIRHLQAIVALTLLSCLVACGTGNVGVDVAPERTSSETFSVSALDGAGTYTPVVNVTEDAGGVTAVVTADAAADLSGAAFHLNYDASRYTPVSVEFGGFIGGEDEVLTLAVTDLAGYVPVAVAQIAGSGAVPVAGSGTLATVRFSPEPFTAARTASTAPLGDSNEVTDLAVIRQGSGTLDLHWTEVNTGDYDNNGYVLASDLVPLGVFYGQSVAASSDPERVAMADGNHNGLIEIGDITPIGVNYEHKVSGYMVYDNAEGTSALSTGMTISRNTAAAQEENDDPNHPLKYTFTTEIPSGFTQYTVRPVDDSDLGNPGVVSNAVAPEADENPPVAPSELTATVGEAVGDRAVQLNWTASTSFDVREYVIEYQMDSLYGVWEDVASVGSSVTSYLHENPLFQEQETYTYRVKAVDYTDLESDYATSDPVAPWFFYLPEPINLTANNQIPTANAIELNWEPPLDDSKVFFYRVYDADTDTLLTTTASQLITTYTHTGLTAGVNYTYYVTSVAANLLESGPSNLANSVPSEITEINITGLTTDKTTHCTTGTEPASNLSVTTDVSFDSVDWDCTLGSVTGSGADVTWAAPTSCSPQKVTITCTVHAGSGQDSQELYLYVTENSIITTIGDNGRYMTGAPTTDMLERLVDGGDTITGRQFEYYMNQDSVVVLSTFDTG